MADPESQRDAPQRGAPGPAEDPRASLVSRWLAVAVLAVILAAAALSAWLLVTADLESARPPIPAEDRGTR